MFLFSHFSWRRTACISCGHRCFKSYTFPIMTVYINVASRALKMAGPCFTVCNDNTVETHDTTAWFQRSMLLVIGPDATITAVTIHHYRGLRLLLLPRKIVCHCHCQKIAWFCACSVWFSVRTNRTTDGRRPSLVLACWRPPDLFAHPWSQRAT
jgi:hypothetical protein